MVQYSCVPMFVVFGSPRAQQKASPPLTPRTVRPGGMGAPVMLLPRALYCRSRHQRAAAPPLFRGSHLRLAAVMTATQSGQYQDGQDKRAKANLAKATLQKQPCKSNLTRATLQEHPCNSNIARATLQELKGISNDKSPEQIFHVQRLAFLPEQACKSSLARETLQEQAHKSNPARATLQDQPCKRNLARVTSQ